MIRTALATGLATAAVLSATTPPTPPVTDGDLPKARVLSSSSFGWQCRTGTARAGDDLTVTGTVCARYTAANWQGRGVVTLTSRGKAVSGNLANGPTHIPELATGDVTNVAFTVPAGGSIRLSFSGSSRVDQADTGVRWGAYVDVPNNGRALPLSGVLYSPAVGRAPGAIHTSTYSGVGRWSCTTRRIAPLQVTAPQVTGKAYLCVRQVNGTVESTGTFSYLARTSPDITFGTTIDRQGAVESGLALPASHGRPVTVTLPITRSQVLTRDHTALTVLRIGTSSLESTPIALR